MKAIKPNKDVKQTLFKNHLKFQYSIKFFPVTWPNVGTNNTKFFIYTKATVRKKTMRQDNFRTCSRCHSFSENLKISSETIKRKIGKRLIYQGLIDFTKYCIMTN